jgi:hypothetical protein
VELNQSSLTRGTGLFDWDDDADVLNGRSEFEFQIVEEWPLKLDEGGLGLAAISSGSRSIAARIVAELEKTQE